MEARNSTPGTWIRKLRFEHGWSQHQLARLLRISQSYLSKIENNRLEISLREWFLFCRITSTDVRSYEQFLEEFEE